VNKLKEKVEGLIKEGEEKERVYNQYIEQLRRELSKKDAEYATKIHRLESTLNESTRQLKHARASF